MTLVYVMLGRNGEWKAHPTGATLPARSLCRIVFTEIATWWIPPDVFRAAFRELGPDEEEDNDA